MRASSLSRSSSLVLTATLLLGGCGGSTNSPTGSTGPTTLGGGGSSAGSGTVSAGGTAGAAGSSGAGQGGSQSLGGSTGVGGDTAGSGGGLPECHLPWNSPADYPLSYQAPGSCYVKPCGNDTVCCAKICIPGYCDMACAAGSTVCHDQCNSTLTCVFPAECPQGGIIMSMN